MNRTFVCAAALLSCAGFAAPLAAQTDPVLMSWTPGSGMWAWTTTGSDSTPGSRQWGNESLGDRPFAADVDGDGATDVVVWRASTGTWYWATAGSGFATAGSRQFGSLALGDVPFTGDIDGDGRADLIVWRASTGTWYWATAASGFTTGGSRQFGNRGMGDIPLLADIDGDRKADFVVWRASTGRFYWATSSSQYTGGSSCQWGSNALGDVPLAADIDGDGHADLAVWRASTGTFYWTTWRSGYTDGDGRQWGNRALGDVPMLADLDHDGRADLAVWRSSTATWYWLPSSGDFAAARAGSKTWGAAGDVPLVGSALRRSSASDLRVLQWNTHHGGVGTDGVYDPDRLATWAARMNPDVIFFNEIERNDSWGRQDQPEVYRTLLQQKTGRVWYYVFAQEFGAWDGSGKGNLILSRFPIAAMDRYELVQNGDRSIAMASIVVNGRPITLLSTHLDPDNATLRLAQATEVTTWASAQPESRILAGDMNAWPDQSSIAQYNRYYVDSWATAASQGTATAFAGNNGETKNGRIDYIFFSKGTSVLAVKSSQVVDTRDGSGVMPSDHRPVLTTFTVR